MYTAVRKNFDSWREGENREFLGYEIAERGEGREELRDCLIDLDIMMMEAPEGTTGWAVIDEADDTVPDEELPEIGEADVFDELVNRGYSEADAARLIGW